MASAGTRRALLCASCIFLARDKHDLGARPLHSDHARQSNAVRFAGTEVHAGNQHANAGPDFYCIERRHRPNPTASRKAARRATTARSRMFIVGHNHSRRQWHTSFECDAELVRASAIDVRNPVSAAYAANLLDRLETGRRRADHSPPAARLMPLRPSARSLARPAPCACQRQRQVRSAPAEFLDGPARVPNFRHVTDLIAGKFHHIDIVGDRAFACRRARTALARMRCLEHAIR